MNQPQQATIEENPNGNCLQGFECPTCGSYGPFRIWASKVGEVIVSDDGTEEDRSCFGDTTWEDDSGCTCCDCGNSGTVREFMGKSAPEFDAFQQIVANTYLSGWDVRFLKHKDDQFPLIFECQAESDEHAIEQAGNAYPGCVIVSVSRFPENEEIKP